MSFLIILIVVALFVLSLLYGITKFILKRLHYFDRLPRPKIVIAIIAVVLYCCIGLVAEYSFDPPSRYMFLFWPVLTIGVH